jgi:predicted transcriptional regulator
VNYPTLSSPDNLSNLDNLKLSKRDKVVNNEKITRSDNPVNIQVMGMYFAEKFLKLRKSKGVSTTLIEERVGIPASNISNIEAGRRRPTDNDLRKLSSIPELQTSYGRLKTWWFIDKFGQDMMNEVLPDLEKELAE